MEHDRMLAAIVETSVFGYAVIDDAFVFRYVSPSLADQVGRTVEELVGTNGLDLVHPDDRDLAALAVLEHIESDGLFDDLGVPVSLRVLRSDGSSTTLEVGALGMFDHPDIRGAVVRTHPMRGREHLNAGLHLLAQGASTRRVLAELVGAAEGIIEDGRGLIAARDPRGFWHLPDDIDPMLALVAPLDDGSTPELWRRTQDRGECQVALLEDLEPQIAEVARAAGYEACWALPVPHLPIEANVIVWRTTRRSPLVSARIELGRVADAVGLAIERDRAIRQLEHAARHDPLTGLANRSTFHQVLADAVERCAAEGGNPIGLLFVDLDRFKGVNDVRGHHVGDAVLQVVGERLRSAVRGSDIVGRLGGDEFGVLCRDVTGVGELESVADRILAHLAEPVVLDGARSPEGLGEEAPAAEVGASVGIAIAGPEWLAELIASGIEPGDRLLAAADRAMYEAKRSGRGRATDPIGDLGPPAD